MRIIYNFQANGLWLHLLNNLHNDYVGGGQVSRLAVFRVMIASGTPELRSKTDQSPNRTETPSSFTSRKRKKIDERQGSQLVLKYCCMNLWDLPYEKWNRPFTLKMSGSSDCLTEIIKRLSPLHWTLSKYVLMCIVSDGILIPKRAKSLDCHIASKVQ